MLEDEKEGGMMPSSDRKLSPKEAAARVEVSVATIREYIRKGALHKILRGPGPRPRVLLLQSEVDQLFRRIDN